MTEQLPVINTSHNVTATKGQSSSLFGRGLVAIQNKVLTEEEESRLLPIMAKIFHIAAKMIELKLNRPANFEESAGYVMQQIRELTDKKTADKLTIQHLRVGYSIAGGEDFEGMAKYKSTDSLETAYKKSASELLEDDYVFNNKEKSPKN